MMNFVRSYSTRFVAGDLAIIQPLRSGTAVKRWLSKPLEPGARLNINTGSIPHDEIIGTYPRSKVYEIRGNKRLNKYIISRPGTEEYINMTSRDAQPIYPFDAAAIVSLADIHLSYDGDLMQFFEAGTGHGSLTLQICKAIHCANARAGGDLSKRGAILHSLDCNKRHSQTGQRTIDQFRNGLYKQDVEFHLSESPTVWLGSEADEWRALTCPKTDDEKSFQHPSAFLSGAFLDMGGFELQLEAVAQNLLLDAPLLVFCPSMSQVMDALKLLDANPQIKLQFIRTVQLLDGAGGGLKEWDTRKAFIKATGKEGWVCRPKVGNRVVGGGFVIVFKKPAIGIDMEKELEEMQRYKEEKEEEMQLEKERVEAEKEEVAKAAEAIETTQTEVGEKESEVSETTQPEVSDKEPEESLDKPQP